MLWIDKQWITQASLEAIEPGVAQATSDSTAVNPTVLIPDTLDELAQEIQEHLYSFGGVIDVDGLGDAHMAAVMNTGGGSGRRHIPLDHVVVDDPDRGIPNSSLRKWTEARCFVAIYDAAAKRIEDSRWTEKADEWRVTAGDRWRVARRGIPIVQSPLPAPGAWRLKDTGSFGATDITTSSAGGSWPAGTYYAAITWTGANYQSAAVRSNSESAGCDAIEFTAVLNDSVTFSVENLNPPPPVNQGILRSGIPWMIPTGWNLYVGSSVDDLRLQNSSPIAIATKTLELTEVDLTGAKIGRGQSPNGTVSAVMTSGLA